MNNKDYIEILKWAYEKRIEGFSEEEFFEKFNPDNNAVFKKWYLQVFRGAINNEECLIGIYDERGGQRYLCLTANGLSAAIAYLSLEDAQSTSRRAEKISRIAIIIGLVVGLVQILLDIIQICGI